MKEVERLINENPTEVNKQILELIQKAETIVEDIEYLTQSLVIKDLLRKYKEESIDDRLDKVLNNFTVPRLIRASNKLTNNAGVIHAALDLPLDIANYQLLTDHFLPKLCYNVARPLYEKILGVQVPAWDAFPDHQVAMRRRVKAHLRGLNHQEVHAEWVARLRSEGWTRGAKRSYIDKTHPHLADWDELKASEKLGHASCYLTVRYVLSKVGRELVKGDSILGMDFFMPDVENHEHELSYKIETLNQLNRVDELLWHHYATLGLIK